MLEAKDIAHELAIEDSRSIEDIDSRDIRDAGSTGVTRRGDKVFVSFRERPSPSVVGEIVRRLRSRE